MAAQVVPFAFENREIRTFLIDDQPWFVAGDIAKALNYRDSEKMSRNLDEDEKDTRIVGTPFGDQEMTIINESGMYSAILRSRKPEAKRFKKWVTAEVLPSIRKHGFYGNAPKSQQVIGSEGMRCLSALIKGKTSHLTGREQKSASTRLWNQLHTAFDVCSGMDIPEDQFNDARTFIASYAIEGEYLAKEERRGDEGYYYQEYGRYFADGRAILDELDKYVQGDAKTLLKQLDNVLLCSWTHMDESLSRLKVITAGLEKWRGPRSNLQHPFAQVR